MTAKPNNDVDAIAEDPTVLLERPAPEAFASVALPRPNLAARAAANAAPRTEPPAVESIRARAPATAAAAASTPSEPEAAPAALEAAPERAPRRTWRPDRLAIGAIAVAIVLLAGATWLLVIVLRT